MTAFDRQVPATASDSDACKTTSVRNRLRRFRDDESGVMVFLGMFIFLIILMTGGIAVDYMRNEQNRTMLQHTLDRAVLAAADLDQSLDPTQVVNSYFEKPGMGDFLAEVNVDEGLNFRTVSAKAQATQPAEYLQFVGRDTLVASASATAEERIAKVEISMVLDISGSMGSNNKMGNLRDAARTFVDTVITPETQDLISVSVVPYTSHVNAGPMIFDELNTAQKHNFSHCVEFEDHEFSTTVFNTNRTYEQGQHVEFSSRSSGDITNPGCPQRSYERISPFSQNASALKSQIGNLRARANTSIFLGMKWAVSLLDPSFRPIVDSLVTKGDIDATFSGRPAEYDDPETLKTVILMTDGVNVTTRRVADWAYSVESHYVHWDRFPVYYYLNRYVNHWQHNQFYYTKYTSSEGDRLLDDICDAAKDRGIVIWSVGFEVNDHGADVMRDCASSPAHFFRVEGVEITEAFEAIARQINQLRLTQ